MGGVAKRSEECAGYDGKEMIAPSMEEMNKLIVEHVVKKTLEETILKSGENALTLYGNHTHLHINPSGKFIIGGPRVTLGSPGARSPTRTVAGARTAAALSPGRTRRRSIARLRTSPGRW